MIPIEQLSIGNYVYIPQYDVVGNVESVLNFGGGDASLTVRGNNGMVYLGVKLSEIDPIPISEQLLLNNDYELITKDTINIYLSKDRRINIMFETDYVDRFWNIMIDSPKYTSSARVDVYYVHEMQNILSLCALDANLKFKTNE